MKWYSCGLLGEEWAVFVKAPSVREAKKKFFKRALKEGWADRESFIYVRCRRERFFDPEWLEKYADSEGISRPPACEKCGLYFSPGAAKCPLCEEE